MIYRVQTASGTIEYELVRKRVKNINLRIRADGSVVVSCNSHVSRSFIEDFIREKQDFIFKGIRRSEQRIEKSARPVEYRDGEKVNVFGMYKTLRIVKAPKNRVMISSDEVTLELKDPDDDALKERVYTKWKRELLKREVLDLCDEVYDGFKTLGVKYPTKINFRTMRSRWGSCQPVTGVLCFNYNLFETPPECIRYVVIHEFSHFIEANHSPRFYNVVKSFMPGYSKWRKMLNDY